MNLAAVDIGTNSLRLMIAKGSNDGLEIVVNQLRTPRLGEGINKDGHLKEEAIKRTVAVLKEYKELIAQYQATAYLVATSAVRDANNREYFLDKVKEETGFEVMAILGEEEARLSYLGITSALSDLDEDVLAVDIGGGSTEFIFGNSEEFREYRSINLGAVRLTESYKQNLNKMKDKAKEMANDILKNKKVGELVAVGGTVTTAVAIKEELQSYKREVVHGYSLSRSDIEKILDYLSNLSLEQRKEVIGLNPKRADIIVAGIVILLEIVKESGVSEIKVSDASILEGLIYDNLK